MSKAVSFPKINEKKLVQNNSRIKPVAPLSTAECQKIYLDTEFGSKIVNYLLQSVYQRETIDIKINNDESLTKDILFRFTDEVEELFENALLHSIVEGGSILFPVDTRAHTYNNPSFYSKELSWRFFSVADFGVVPNPIPFDKDFYKPMYYIAYNYVLTRERVIEFIHKDVPRHTKPLFNFMGSSIYEPMQDAITQDAYLTTILSNYVDRGSQIYIFLKEFTSAMMNKKTIDNLYKKLESNSQMKAFYNDNILDIEDRVEMQNLNLRGVGELVKERSVRVANASEVPLSLLTSTTIDDNSLSLFYKNINNYRVTKIKSYLTQVLRILIASETQDLEKGNKADIEINFDNLFMLNPLQQSAHIATVLDNGLKLQKLGIDKDKILKYLNKEVDVGNKLNPIPEDNKQSNNQSLGKKNTNVIPTREDLRNKNDPLKV